MISRLVRLEEEKNGYKKETAIFYGKLRENALIFGVNIVK